MVGYIKLTSVELLQLLTWFICSLYQDSNLQPLDLLGSTYQDSNLQPLGLFCFTHKFSVLNVALVCLGIKINPGVEGSNLGRLNQVSPGVEGSNPGRVNKKNMSVSVGALRWSAATPK